MDSATSPVLISGSIGDSISIPGISESRCFKLVANSLILASVFSMPSSSATPMLLTSPPKCAQFMVAYSNLRASETASKLRLGRSYSSVMPHPSQVSFSLSIHSRSMYRKPEPWGARIHLCPHPA